MSTNDVPGFDPANGDELHMGCWAEHKKAAAYTGKQPITRLRTAYHSRTAMTHLTNSLPTYRRTVFNRLPAQWRSAGRTLAVYWNAYGGWRSLWTSPYLWLAAVATALASPYWYSQDKWIQNAVDIVPGLLGFSIGAFAILLVFSSDRFLSLISQEGRAGSIFMLTSAMFVHFILLQVCALVVALLSNAFPVFSGLGFFLLMYSIFSGAAVALALFNLAQVYNSAAHLVHRESSAKTTDRPPA